MKRRRTQPPPVIVGPEGGRSLQRIPPEDPAIKERWLQDLLFRHPDLIPVAEVDAEFTPLRAVAREVRTDAGPIDVLFASPSGFLTIVETKLHRSPEARREVYAQTLDYCKELADWSYEKLVAAVRNARVRASEDDDPLLGAVKHADSRADHDVDPEEFRRTVAAGLRHGRFLVLLIGDEIHDELERLIEYVQRFMHLQFTVRLIEMQVYRMDEAKDSPLFVVPRLVAKTSEIVRATVRMKRDDELQHIVLEPAGDERTTPGLERFFEMLQTSPNVGSVDAVASLLAQLEQLGLYVDILRGRATDQALTGVAVRFGDPAGTGREFRVMRITREGTVASGQLRRQLRERGYAEEIAIRYWETIAAWLPGTRADDDVRLRNERTGEPVMFPIKVLAEAHRDEYLRLVERVVGEIRAAAAQSEEA